jgi:hypothetical protein
MSGRQDAEYVMEICAKLRAAHARRLICSRQTFTDFLEYDQLIAGPWEWTIADATPYGRCRVIGPDHTEVCTMTLSTLELTH